MARICNAGEGAAMSHTISKSEMRDLFNRITGELSGTRVEVEIESLQLGDHIEAQWVPLLGLSYDPGDDAIAIILEGIDITISRPREIYSGKPGATTPEATGSASTSQRHSSSRLRLFASPDCASPLPPSPCQGMEWLVGSLHHHYALSRWLGARAASARGE
jgi:hypothetical protein